MLSSVCVCVCVCVRARRHTRLCDTHMGGGERERGRDITLVFPLQTPSVSCLFRERQLHCDTNFTFVLGCLAVKAVRLYVSTATEFHSMVQNFILNIYNLNYMCTISSHHKTIFQCLFQSHEHTLLH